MELGTVNRWRIIKQEAQSYDNQAVQRQKTTPNSNEDKNKAECKIIIDVVK